MECLSAITGIPRWPKERRQRHFRWASVAALFIAGFLAYDDMEGHNRKLERDATAMSSKLSAALGERDESRRQYAILLDSMNKSEGTIPGAVPPSVAILAPSTPEWVKIAYNELGVREIPGPQENPHIVKYFSVIGAKPNYRDDIDDWASAFVEWSLNQVEIYGPKSDEPFAWLEWGKELDKPVIGCIVVMSFSGLHHVGFYFGEDADFVHVLGGNEDDAVNIFRYPKSSVYGYRWPPKMPIPNNH